MTEGTPSSSRTTRQGQAVRSAMEKAGSFRSAQDVYALLRSTGEAVGLTTVYRHLALLADAGHLDSLRRADGELVYRRCSSPGLHHHVVCRLCGQGNEVQLPELDRWAETAAHALGYTEITHSVEIFGRCPECRTDGI